MSLQSTRPMLTSASVIRMAAEALAPRIVAWIGGSSTTLDQIITDLESVMKCGEIDGYRIARALENLTYSPDAELVEILDNAIADIDYAHNAAIEAWVSENSVSVPFEIGQQVRSPRGKGKIVDINFKRAEVCVAVPPKYTGEDKSGFIFPAERCSLCGDAG